MVRLQQHLPEQAQEEWRRALHGEVSDDVVLVGHGLPLAVLLLYVLLQVEAALLGNVVLLEERLLGAKETQHVRYKAERLFDEARGKSERKGKR